MRLGADPARVVRAAEAGQDVLALPGYVASLNGAVVREVVAAVKLQRWRLARARTGNPDQGRAHPMLFVGPTGCGKTHLAKCAGRQTELPYAESTARAVVEQGFGPIVHQLFLDRSDPDELAAQHGVVMLDEIDKIGRDEASALLTVLWGDQGRYVHPRGFAVDFSTSQLLFFAAGVFDGWDQHARSRVRGGFRGSPAAAESPTPEDLAPWISPEVTGRLQCRHLYPLSVEDLVGINRLPESPLAQLATYLRDKSVSLEADEAFEVAVAENAAQLGLGARGLAQILIPLFANLMGLVDGHEPGQIRAIGLDEHSLEEGNPVRVELRQRSLRIPPLADPQAELERQWRLRVREAMPARPNRAEGHAMHGASPDELAEHKLLADLD